MQSQEVILSWFTNQFLIEGDGDHLTVREMWGRTRPLQGVKEVAIDETDLLEWI